MEARNDEGMSGALDWVLNEPKYIDSVLCDEIPGMSDVWDWVLKETPRSGSVTRRRSGKKFVVLSRDLRGYEKT